MGRGILSSYVGDRDAGIKLKTIKKELELEIESRKP